MKRFLNTIIINLLLLNLFAQEKWNNESGEYTNHEYSFHWNLPKNLGWHKSQGNEKHTAFKAISNYGIIVFVNINPYDNLTAAPDMWENFEKYKKIYEYSWAKTKERTGGDTKPIKLEKCRFAGANAIKIIVKQSIKNDVIDEVSYGITYNFHKDNAMWSVSLKCSEDVYLSAGAQELKNIFSGFGLNAKTID